MDKKILKYKEKKNKLESKILNLLNTKKTIYENDIVDSNNSQLIINLIENYLNELNKQQTKKLLIIVNGIYSVGKSTFINHLENYINKLSDIILNELKINIKNILSNDINNDIEIINNIIIIEINNNNLNKDETINKISSQLLEQSSNNLDIINIDIIPKSKNSLKNKYINKIIFDIKNNKTDFISRLNFTDNQIINKIQNNIESLKLKDNIYSDDDFNFLDDIVDITFNIDLCNFINNQNKLLNIYKFHL